MLRMRTAAALALAAVVCVLIAAPGWSRLTAAGSSQSIARDSHDDLIVAATREKVRQNPDVRNVLLATGDLILKPDHVQEPNATAAWRYCEILTAIRAGLRKQE